MAQSLQPYINEISRTLNQALCIQPFPSRRVDCYNAPEVEVRDSPELLLEPILISRSSKECCLIERSINSIRVSLQFNAGDALESELRGMYTKFIMQRAESMQIVRKVPVQGYHISFLITDTQLVTMGKQAIMRLILGLIQQFESEVSGLRLSVNARGRAVAHQLLKSLAF